MTRIADRVTRLQELNRNTKQLVSASADHNAPQILAVALYFLVETEDESLKLRSCVDGFDSKSSLVKTQEGKSRIDKKL